MTADPIELGHVLTDSEFARFQIIESVGKKILASHRSGSLGMIGERQRLLEQLATAIEMETT